MGFRCRYMKIVIDGITLKPDDSLERIGEILATRYGLGRDDPYEIIRKSLDARRKDRIHYRFRVAVEVPDEAGKAILSLPEVSCYRPLTLGPPRRRLHGLKAYIAGTGPAGLFCALRLIEAGAEVEIFERGKRVEERARDIATLEERGTLNPESNVLFGEGGAGAYSDGKLTARTQSPESRWLFERLVSFGAPSAILYEAKPHLGTDALEGIIKAIRRRLLEAGARINFSEAVTDLIIRDGLLAGFLTSRGKEYTAGMLVLAVGHSARDTYEMLERRGVAIAQKGFAVGVRIEHPAEIINRIQYGDSHYGSLLPAAEYALAWTDPGSGRGVYTFCMCPGGRVINSSSEHGRLCLNGMSYAARDLPFSNAAVVVAVHPREFGDDVLAGMAFQRMLEEAAFTAGGGDFRAPAQRLTDFLADRENRSIPSVSYRPGVRPASVRTYLPQWLAAVLAEGFKQFGRRMKGFITDEAVVFGVETRTSSPARVVRGDDFQSVTVRGLFPIGEGSGYAGGIVSSAVDGIRCADRIAAMVRPT